MSKIVTLSTGEQVHLKEKFTHAAEKAYSAAVNQGAVDRDYFDEKEGKYKTERVTPVANYRAAEEAALRLMVEKVVNAGQETTASEAWMGELDESDYSLLVTEMVSIRKTGLERGKKSAGRA